MSKIWLYFLLVLISAPFSAVVGYSWDYKAGLLALILFILFSFYVYKNAYRVFIIWYDCLKKFPNDYLFLHDIIANLSKQYTFNAPILKLFSSSTPVIFTVGTRTNSIIVISTGFVDVLNNEEIEIMLMRELVRIQEGHVSYDTFVTLIAGLISSLSSVVMWVCMLVGLGQEKDPVPQFIRFAAMGIFMLPSALVIYLFLTNSTINVDILTCSKSGKKDNLLSALNKMNNSILINSFEYFNPAHAVLFAMSPIKVSSFYDIHLSFFEMKPGLSQRLNIINGIDVQSEVW